APAALLLPPRAAEPVAPARARPTHSPCLPGRFALTIRICRGWTRTRARLSFKRGKHADLYADPARKLATSSCPKQRLDHLSVRHRKVSSRGVGQSPYGRCFETLCWLSASGAVRCVRQRVRVAGYSKHQVRRDRRGYSAQKIPN